MRHDRRIAFSCDMSHKRINESDDTGLKGKTKERRSPGCSQTHGLAQAESAISTEGRRCPRETLFSHHVRLVAELGRRPSIPSPTQGRDSGKISKRPSDGTAPEMSQPTSIQMLDTAIWKELGVEEVAESEAFYHAKIPQRQAKTQFLIGWLCICVLRGFAPCRFARC